MSAGAHPATSFLRIKVRRIDLPVLRAACRVAGVQRLESFAAEILESAIAEYRRNKIEPEQGKWDELDRKVFRDTNVEVHRRVLNAGDEQRALALVAQGEGDRAIAKRFGVWPGTIGYLRNRKKGNEP